MEKIQFFSGCSLLAALLAVGVFNIAKAESFSGKTEPDASTEHKVESTGLESDRDHYRTARSLIQQDRYEDAAGECQRAISINSKKSLYYDTLGFCLERLRRYDEAIQAFNQAVSLNQKDDYAYRELGTSYYQKRAYEGAVASLQQCVLLKPSDADGYRWLGFAFYALHRYDAAANSFDEAIKLKQNDFPNNHWRGASLLLAGRFGEAIPNLEKANQFNKDDKPTQHFLFSCYLITGQYGKAFRLFPSFVAVVGSALTLIYLTGLAILLRFSFKVRPASAPGVGFSIAWLALFAEGQIACIFFLGLLSWIKISESPLVGIILAGVPVIVVATAGFARQPWGEPFRWPERFLGWKVISLSLLFLLLSFLFNFGFSEVVEQITHQPVPLQRVIPFIKAALNANPLLAFVTIGIIAPIVEEILFRGLLYGALTKWLRAGWVVVVSSFAFALIHLEIVGFVPIFCLGSILGWARWKSGSLGLPILIHVLNNCLAVLALKFQNG
jgi:membrane protease YdiL (CAAX protease family)/tetratricopeptide (TPR) repeat protein